MDDVELLSLLDDGESDHVERKPSLGQIDRIRDAICAFANDLVGRNRAGVVFVGVEDNGSCSGLSVDDRMLLTASALRDDGTILPIPSMSVERRILRGCEVLVIVVQPSAFPPVRVRGLTMIRVGPRRAVATREEELRLAERARGNMIPFESRGVPTATVDDLDMDLFGRTYVPAALSDRLQELDDRPRS